MDDLGARGRWKWRWRKFGFCLRGCLPDNERAFPRRDVDLVSTGGVGLPIFDTESHCGGEANRLLPIFHAPVTRGYSSANQLESMTNRLLPRGKRGTPGAILAALLVASACSKNPAQNPQAGGPQAMPVKVLEAKAVPVNDSSEYVATLKSRDSAVIMPQVEGQVTQIFVHSGDRVSEGGGLMEIDPLKQQATVKSLESSRAAQRAQLALAKQQYERAEGLSRAGVVSKQDLDQAKATLDAAQAQMDSLDAQVREQQVQLRYYKVVAPREGIVGDIPVRVGDRVTTQTQLTTLDQPGNLEVYVFVPIERSSRLKMGLPVQVLDGNGKVLAGTRVSFISPQVDNSTQTVLVKARIANENEALRQSQFIRARIVWGTHQNPQIPILAVSRLAGQYFAFVAEPQNGGAFVARQRPLAIGQTVGNDYEVREGIKPGDKVIISGTQFLLDGAPVIPHS
jgi:RND family efflux transporter MFP subunit